MTASKIIAALLILLCLLALRVAMMRIPSGNMRISKKYIPVIFLGFAIGIALLWWSYKN